MTNEELSDYKKKLLSLIPDDGSSIGNIALLQTFREKEKKDLRDDEYWEIRNGLIEDGHITTARGRGGSVYRLEVEEKTPTATTKKILKEKELYDPLITTIQNFWVKNYGIKNYILEKTANQGKRKTGGKWTRPDLSLISIKSYPFIPGKILEVTTFEVKPSYDYGVESVFETAAHSLFANRSYLAINLPEGRPKTEDFEKIEKQCESFGVGLIIFEDPLNWETFDILIESKRKEPDPADINLFITQQISSQNKTELLEKLKY